MYFYLFIFLGQVIVQFVSGSGFGLHTVNGFFSSEPRRHPTGKHLIYVIHFSHKVLTRSLLIPVCMPKLISVIHAGLPSQILSIDVTTTLNNLEWSAMVERFSASDLCSDG